MFWLPSSKSLWLDIKTRNDDVSWDLRLDVRTFARPDAFAISCFHVAIQQGTWLVFYYLVIIIIRGKKFAAHSGSLASSFCSYPHLQRIPGRPGSSTRGPIEGCLFVSSIHICKSNVDWCPIALNDSSKACILDKSL